jgi:hypothetical protein
LYVYSRAADGMRLSRRRRLLERGTEPTKSVTAIRHLPLSSFVCWHVRNTLTANRAVSAMALSRSISGRYRANTRAERRAGILAYTVLAVHRNSVSFAATGTRGLTLQREGKPLRSKLCRNHWPVSSQQYPPPRALICQSQYTRISSSQHQQEWPPVTAARTRNSER